MTDSLAKPRYRSAWHVVQVVLHEKDLPNRSRLRNTIAGMGNFYRVSFGMCDFRFLADKCMRLGNCTGGLAGVSYKRGSIGCLGSRHESSRGERGMG